jgi:DNA repair exonuclease SbcCD nuclease subunit
MNNLFKKAAAFTDIHFGLKSNSVLHLNDCEEFVDWFIDNSKKEGCDTGIFMGDWSHNRNNLNLMTLDTSIRCLEKLGSAFKQFFWFPGNHDLFYKDKRDIHSSVYGKHIPGITVIDNITTLGDVTLVPWLVNDEWKNISKIKSKYMFGHFELPLFYMNAMVQMPDHGELQVDHFKHQEYIFSGHFHKRQNKDKVWYIGNAFPHNFSDIWDDDRGMMILEWGGTPKFINWDNCPKFRNVTLSQLIDQKDKILKSKMYLKVKLDIDINFEEANFIKETFVKDYDIREISLIQERNVSEVYIEDTSEIKFEGVDHIVTNSLISVESDHFDKKTLLDIYKNL